jgi:hypothetical protein
MATTVAVAELGDGFARTGVGRMDRAGMAAELVDDGTTRMATAVDELGARRDGGGGGRA